MLRSCLLFALLAAATPSAGETTGPVLLHEAFEAVPAGTTLPAGWWSEGSKAVAAKDGQLVQDANPDGSGETSGNSVIWIGTEFAGDIRFEADVKVASAKGNVNDIVVFFLFSSPAGKALRETSAERVSAKQGLYTKHMNGYVFFFWGKGGVTTPANIRLRDCPGGKLLRETNAHSVTTGKTYRLAIEKQGTVLRLFADGVKCAEHDTSTDLSTNPDHAKGLIGLKTWNTELVWDNIRVTQIPTKP